MGILIKNVFPPLVLYSVIKQEVPPTPDVLETSGDPAHLAKFMFWWKLNVSIVWLESVKLFILIN